MNVTDEQGSAPLGAGSQEIADGVGDDGGGGAKSESIDAYLGALVNGTALNGTQAPSEAPPAPPPFLQFPDQDTFVSSCATSSSPICYNTSISGENIVTNLWFSAVLGLLCYLSFVAFRTKFRLYQARLHMPTVIHKPPKLLMSAWHHRWWSWVVPVFRVSDEELLKSAGMDALIAVKILYFGILCFLPITLAAMAILIPVNYTDDYYSKTAQESGISDSYSTVFIRLTMSNITPGSSVLWVHFFFVYGAVFWTCWLITEFYKEYVSLRQAYVIRNTEAVGAHIGGSAEAFEQDTRPLITPRWPVPNSSMRRSMRSLTEGDGTTANLGHASGPSDLRRNSMEFINDVKNAARVERLSTLNTPLRILHGDGSPRKDSISAMTNRSVSLSGRSVYETPYNARQPAGGSPSRSPAASVSGVSDRGGEETETDTESVVDRHVTFSERWTEHDFSKDVMVAPGPASTGIGCAARGALGGQGGRRSPKKHARSGSAAAVAIALDMGEEMTAATALAKIRHHRAASGASYASSLSNTTPTPRDSPRGSPKGEQGVDGTVLNVDEASSMLRIPEDGHDGHDDSLQGSDSRTISSKTANKTTQTSRSLAEQPAGLVQIITNVAEDDEGSNRAGNCTSELPTSMALDPLMCDPEGQQGIGHQWWSYMKDAGSGRIRSEQIKGFVQPDMMINPDAGDQEDPAEFITVNASLYTVLVTDEPIEKLRLNKPFRKTTTGLRQGEAVTRKKHASSGRSLDVGEDDISGKPSGKDGDIDVLATVPSDAPAYLEAEAIPVSRNSTDLERGAISAATRRKESFHFPKNLGSSPNSGGSRELLTVGAAKTQTEEAGASIDPLKTFKVSERGMGVSAGWSATIANLKQLWKHKGGYKEWRSDVRWAMFRKRARIATQMFTELFGDDFDSLIPIYPTQSVDKLISLWDKKCAKLERAQYDLKALLDKETSRIDQLDALGTDWRDSQLIVDKRLIRYRKRLSDLKGRIVKLKEETTNLQDQIVQEREHVLSGLPSTCFFATFKSQEAAAIASQANLNPIKERLLNVHAAPSPDDVNWPTLTRSWWQRQSRPIIVLPLILFIMLLPIGAFSGAFAQLTIAVCGSPADPTKEENTSWYCSADPWANFFRNLVTSLAPTLLLSLYHMCILPVLVYYAAQAEGQQTSLSGLDRRCCSLFFYWDVFNVFLGAMLGGSVIAELPTYIEDPTQIWNALSAAIPSSSNFFINYVAYRALVMAWFRLWYPHLGTTVSMLKWMRILPWAKSPREKALESPIRNCRYGRDIGIPVLMNFVMVMAYCVVSPLILPFGLLYFILLWSVWRYQMLYVYQRSYESGGLFWPLVAHRVVICLFICVLFTSVVFVLKEAYTQAALMLVSLPLYLLRYDIYISKRYDQVVEQIPLTAVHQAGRVASVDPTIWHPPPLREGAEGWHPQWGVVWQYWGVPRYSL